MIKTKERLKITTGGWDGTGYDGEATERPIYTNAKNEKFIKARFNGVWAYLRVSDERHEVSGELTAHYFDDCKTADELERVMAGLRNNSRKTA